MAENNSFYTGNVPPAFQGEIDSLDIEEQLNLLKNSYIFHFTPFYAKINV